MSFIVGCWNPWALQFTHCSAPTLGDPIHPPPIPGNLGKCFTAACVCGWAQERTEMNTSRVLRHVETTKCLGANRESWRAIADIWVVIATLWRLPRWFSGKEFTRQWRRHGFDPWVRKIPRRKEWQPAPISLPGKSYGQRSPEGYSPRGHKELDTIEWLSSHNYSLQTFPVFPGLS